MLTKFFRDFSKMQQLSGTFRSLHAAFTPPSRRLSNRFFKPIFCENFQIAAVRKDANLEELEKCCRTHILLQNLASIQPRTSPPKICKICKKNCQFSRFALPPTPVGAADGPGVGAAVGGSALSGTTMTRLYVHAYVFFGLRVRTDLF